MEKYTIFDRVADLIYLLCITPLIIYCLIKEKM